MAVLGIISVLVIPNFLESYQKGKQKRTMADMHKTGQAMINWLTGQIGAMGAGSNTLDLTGLYDPIDHTTLDSELVPQFTAILPITDAWGTPYQYFVNIDQLTSPQVLAIRSAGSDGIFAGPVYTYGPFTTTDFRQDIIWADGVFVRWPVGAR